MSLENERAVASKLQSFKLHKSNSVDILPKSKFMAPIRKHKKAKETAKNQTVAVPINSTTFIT